MKKMKISHTCCKLAMRKSQSRACNPCSRTTAACSHCQDLVGVNEEGRNKLWLGLNPQRQEHFGARLRADISNALGSARGEPDCPGGKELCLCLSRVPVLVTDFVVIHRAWSNALSKQMLAQL